MDLYLDHISAEHRGKPLGDVIEYKTRCIGNRIADDKELFDINIWPRVDEEDRKTSKWLSDDLLERPRTLSTAVNPQVPVVHEQKAIRSSIIRDDLKTSQSTHHLQPESTRPSKNDTSAQTFLSNPAEVSGTPHGDLNISQASMSSVRNHRENSNSSSPSSRKVPEPISVAPAVVPAQDQLDSRRERHSQAKTSSRASSSHFQTGITASPIPTLLIHHILAADYIYLRAAWNQ